MKKICSSIHNMAFIMEGRVNRNTVLLELLNFAVGVSLGIALCSALIH
jgi:hypothetical protein